MSFSELAVNHLAKAQVLRAGLNEREQAIFEVKVAQVYATLHVGAAINRLPYNLTPDQITMVQAGNGTGNPAEQDNDESQ